MAWSVEFTDQFEAWFVGLDDGEQDAIDAAVLELQARGSALRRPYVMKELIPKGGNLRVLFAFDPRRNAILLIGGDKTDRWESFYREYIPIADDLYDAYLDELREEGLL